MIEMQFTAICKLNRLLVLALAAVSVASLWHQPEWWGKALFLGLMAVHFGFLMTNEFLLKIVKRLRDAEGQTLTHISIFLPTLLGVYIAFTYGLTGQFLAFLMGAFSILQAQYLGQAKLSKVLGLLYLGIFLAGTPFGLPKSFSLTAYQMFFVMLGYGICFYAYGAMVSQQVRSHSSEVGKLQSMAATDALTGLTNRRQFNSRLHEEVARARRHETPLSLALFDLDDFKRLNDFYGHPVGDRILRELGKLVRQNIRESDLPARYGGEEFALILPETREAEAYELLERIRLMVAQTVFCLPENPLTISISVGVAQLEPRQHTAFELVELTDKALYEAKRNGKNQVVKASTLSPQIMMGKHLGKLLL